MWVQFPFADICLCNLREAPRQLRQGGDGGGIHRRHHGLPRGTCVGGKQACGLGIVPTVGCRLTGALARSLEGMKPCAPRPQDSKYTPENTRLRRRSETKPRIRLRLQRATLGSPLCFAKKSHERINPKKMFMCCQFYARTRHPRRLATWSLQSVSFWP